MKKRVIVCGFGFMGQNHAANIFKSSDLELAAVVDPMPKENHKPVAGNVATATFDWALLDNIPFYATISEAVANCSFDAAVICSPTFAHAAAAVECVENGKSVFLEKPLCSDMNEAQQILSAIDGKDCVFHVGHCLRFFPEYSYLKKICSEKTYGELKYLKLLRKTGVPSWGAWKDKDTSIGSITGPVFDLNIHDVDFALYVAGVPQTLTAEREPYAEKLFKSIWKYDSGLTVEIEGGFAAQSFYPFRAGYTAIFENAILEFNTLAKEPLVLTTSEGSTAVTPDAADGYLLELQAFTAELLGKSADHCSVQEAANAVEYSKNIIANLI